MSDLDASLKTQDKETNKGKKMFVYSLSVAYEGPFRLYASLADAEAALAEGLASGDFDADYFVEEWPVH